MDYFDCMQQHACGKHTTGYKQHAMLHATKLIAFSFC